MKFSSDKGEWDSLQIMRDEYLNSQDGEKFWLDPNPFSQDKWNPDAIHASDVGGCPRAAMYRLRGEPEKPRSAKSKANRTVMFWAAYRFHFLGYSALNWAGLLMGHELDVGMPEGWAGRADALIQVTPDSEPILYDMKTVLPNALKKYRWDHPKDKNCMQVYEYGKQLGIHKALIEYTDRAGSERPELCEIDLDEWADEATYRELELESYRDHLPELPPILEPVLKGSYWKVRNINRRDVKSVSYGPSFECSYCNYHLHLKDSGTQASSSCHPYFKPPEVVAEFKQGRLIRCTKGHEDGVAAWLGSHVTSYQIEEEGE
jgi:hypothetical protein